MHVLLAVFVSNDSKHDLFYERFQIQFFAVIIFFVISLYISMDYNSDK